MPDSTSFTAYSFILSAWSAWSPSLTSWDSWQSWQAGGSALSSTPEKLSAEFIPALIRRRCSAMSRAALSVAAACLEGDKLCPSTSIRTIFASRHGESDITLKILKELASSSAPSPNDFSLSVHNTASGLYSILAKNVAPATAIAAGQNSFSAAIFELLSATSRARENEQFLVVVSDMPCPKDFLGGDTSPQSPTVNDLASNDPAYAVALKLQKLPKLAPNDEEPQLLFSKEASSPVITFELESESQVGNPVNAAGGASQVEDFLRGAFSERMSCRISTKGDQSGPCWRIHATSSLHNAYVAPCATTGQLLSAQNRAGDSARA